MPQDFLEQTDFWRQIDIFDPSQYEDIAVTMIGAGSIGSFTLLTLVKMGIKKITVYDGDTVERHNVPNQLYRFEDIGRPKVEAIADICRMFSGAEIVAIPEYYTGQPLSGIVVSGVDSMVARKLIWENVRYNIRIPVYVEARMGAQVARVSTVDPRDPSLVEWYETTLYSDAEALDAPCTERSIVYNVSMIAGHLGNQLKKIIKGEDAPKEIIFDCVTVILTQKPMCK